MRKVAMTGGPPVTVCRFEGQLRGRQLGRRRHDHLRDHDPATGLMSVPAARRRAESPHHARAARKRRDHVFPSLLPGGRAVLFTILTTPAIGIERQRAGGGPRSEDRRDESAAPRRQSGRIRRHRACDVCRRRHCCAPSGSIWIASR